MNLASRSDTYFFRVRSSLPAARPAADLSQPCAPPVGLSPATRSPGVLLAFTGVVWFCLTGGYGILISTGIGTDPAHG